jgi:L-threonylcarbamoyladenylate synthase
MIEGRYLQRKTSMQIVDAGAEALDRAAQVLRDGGVVAFPTETVYGLGANAFDADAVARIFEIKQRPHFDPLIVHVLNEAMLAKVAADVSARAGDLAALFWPGPLTLILRKRDAVPDLVTAGLPTVAVRMPAHPVARALLERVQLPIAAPSANMFGLLSPTRAEHVARMLEDRVDLIIDDGPSEHGLESTIVQLDPTPAILRLGAIPVAQIEAVTGPLKLLLRQDDDQPTEAPGRFLRHYAPRTPIRLVDFAHVPAGERRRAGALAYRNAPQGYQSARVLSAAGDLREAAARFFELLHELDAAEVDRIDAEPLPEKDLGAAMMDRLRRATSSVRRTFDR